MKRQTVKNISIALDYVCKNKPSEAFYILNEVYKTDYKNTADSLITKFILSEIGIANIPLVKYLIPINNHQLKNVVILISRSYKSAMVKYMDMYFRKWYIEPFPSITNYIRDMKGRI